MTEARIFIRLLIGTVIVSISAIIITTLMLYSKTIDAREMFLAGIVTRYRQGIVAAYEQIELHSLENHSDQIDTDKNYVSDLVAEIFRRAVELNVSHSDASIVMGTLRDGEIIFLTADETGKSIEPVVMGSDLAMPMQLALQGKTGHLRSKDYAGRMVIAAYTNVPTYNIGIVAKSLVSDINQRFAIGATMAVLPALLIIILGAWYFLIVINRVVDNLRRDNSRYRNAVERLNESESRLKAFLNASFEGFAITESGKFVDANDRMAEMLGYSTDEIRGMEIQKLVHPDDAEMVRENIAKGYTDVYEHRSIRKDGSVIYVEVHGQMIKLEDKKVRITAINDITARRELSLYKRQASKMTAIGDFAGGIIHDFNNTLQPIMGNAELLLLQCDREGPHREKLEIIAAAAETASQLVRRLQTFTRKEKDPDTKEPLKIDYCVQEAFDFLRSITPTTIDMKLTIDSGLGYVSTNDVLIRQILMNLVKNSTQAIGDNQGHINIRAINDQVKVERFGLKAGRYVKIEVEDDGCGMSEEVLERALDPYYTTKGKQGTGLGLAVINGILEKHNGAIYLQSSIGQGTKATVYLPSLNGDQELEDQCKIELPIPMGDGQRIIFVDDEDYIVQMGKKMLESLNYDVIGFTSSVEALEEIEMNPKAFDVVISDLTMPVMSGVIFLQEARKINPEVKTILTSGLVDDVQDGDKNHSDIIDAYMAKPATRRQYAEVLASVLSERIID